MFRVIQHRAFAHACRHSASAFAQLQIPVTHSRTVSRAGRLYSTASTVPPPVPLRAYVFTNSWSVVSCTPLAEDSTQSRPVKSILIVNKLRTKPVIDAIDFFLTFARPSEFSMYTTNLSLDTCAHITRAYAYFTKIEKIFHRTSRYGDRVRLLLVVYHVSI